jgi:hypothetical protein
VGQQPPVEQEPEELPEEEPILKLKELKVFSIFLLPHREHFFSFESAVTPTKSSKLLPQSLQ